MPKQVCLFETASQMQIRVAWTSAQAFRLAARGYTPIECCFGGESVVDDLVMDHHGGFSQLSGVALRAYTEHFSARRYEPWFVVTGYPDEDACFAIAALAGILPHPHQLQLWPDASPMMRTIAGRDLSEIARIIDDVDRNPDLALSLVDSAAGRLVLSWRQQAHPTCRDRLAWHGGVDRWRSLLTLQNGALLDAAVVVQQGRLELARQAPHVVLSPRVVVVDLSAFGPNSSYYGAWLEQFEVLVAFFGAATGYGTCSFVARDTESATRLFGCGGFLAIYPQLAPGGCGGRERIGGSSRSSFVDWPAALDFGRQLEQLACRTEGA